MLKLHHFTSALTVAVSSQFEVAPDMVELVQANWDAALASNPNLFDGPILTVTAIGPSTIRVAASSYRFLLAAKRIPAVKAALNIRPLAVSGLLECPEGYVFGRRGTTVTEASGVWELVPSGGVQATGESVDLRAQIARELQEEVGLDPRQDQVETSNPVGGIEDLSSGVIDIVIPITTTSSAAEICSVHEARATREYSELRVAWAAPPESGSEGTLLPVSREILAHLAPARDASH